MSCKHPVQPPALARPPLHSSEVALGWPGWPGSCLLVFGRLHRGSQAWGEDVGTSARPYGVAMGWTCSSHGAREFGPSPFDFLAQRSYDFFAVPELGLIMSNRG